MKKIILCLWMIGCVCAFSTAQTMLLRTIKDDVHCRQWVDSVMASLSLKERIGQLLVYTIAPQTDAANRALLRKVVQEYHIGGLLFSGGLAVNQAQLTNEAQQWARVPLMITFDGEWGLAMRLKGMPQFPRNWILGCIQRTELLRAYGKEMARQCREMGVQVNFAPVVDVNVNPRNPVINTRSFGEQPLSVARQAIAYARGLEQGEVLSVCKHFPGHGDTEVDSHKALPLLPFSWARLDSVELYPFRQVIRAGVSGVMVGHLEVPALESCKHLPSSLSHHVVHELLQHDLGFDGLTFTDALAMKGVGNGSDLCLRALQAGNDVLLTPRRLSEELETLVAAVQKGELPQTIIDAKCRKVLTYKYALGLSRRPSIVLDGLEQRIHTASTYQLIQQLKQAALTVLGNRKHTLPLDAGVKQVAVLQVGTVQVSALVQALAQYTTPKVFQIREGMSGAARKQILQRLSHFGQILVCVAGKHPESCHTFFAEFDPSVPTIGIFFTSDKRIPRYPRLVERADAVLLAHTDDDDVQRHVAQVLYGKSLVDGRLSGAITPWFAAGEGVTLTPGTPSRFIPESYGLDAHKLDSMGVIAQAGIAEGAYPGCQLVVLKNGRRVYDRAFGTHTWAGAQTGDQPVRPTDLYDLASLTKTTATLLAVMKLYDQGRIRLSDRVSDYLPYLKHSNKRYITVRELLLHESGLPSTLLFYREAIDEQSYTGRLFRGTADRIHSVRIGRQTWANPMFRFKDEWVLHGDPDSTMLPVSNGLWIRPEFKQEYQRKIAEAPLHDKRYRYSCVGFIVLQHLVEARTGMPLDRYLYQEFYRPMKLRRTLYRPLRFFPADQVVPSSKDAFLRKSLLQGYVHDESAAFQGGVSGNAGLFSTAEEVAEIYQMLLNGGEWQGHRYLSEATCQLFTTTMSRTSRRGLGFDHPDVRHPSKSPCAASVPASVFGHTGFTGTCAWADPVHNLVYVFLCNRLLPHVWNNKLQQLDIRTRIQEQLYRALLK